MLHTCAALLLLLPNPTGPGMADEVRITPGSIVRFASVEEGREALAERDAFLANLGDLERQIRLGTADPVSLERLVEHAQAQVLGWNEADLTRIKAGLDSARARLAPFRLDLPETILLVRTTGVEEAGAAYCRGGQTIVLPQGRLDNLEGEALERLLLHELFHIYSRHNVARQADFYRVVGFRACPPIPLPESLRPRRLTNPDAPTVNCVIDLPGEGEGQPPRTVAPVLLANADQFDPAEGANLFALVQFRLMVVEPTDEGGYRPLLVDGMPVLLDPSETPAYAKATGGNTGYILHPEEILADNFVHLVLGTEGLPSPEVVEKLGRLLTP